MKIVLNPIIFLMFFLVSLAGHANELKAKWSNGGKLSGNFRHCIAINEPAEPKSTTWHDNFLCFNRPNHGFKYSYDGRIAGMKCISMDIKGGVWKDNYLCSSGNKNFNFFQRKLPKGYHCIRIIEPSDPNPRAKGTKGNSNHFCLKK